MARWQALYHHDHEDEAEARPTAGQAHAVDGDRPGRAGGGAPPTSTDLVAALTMAMARARMPREGVFFRLHLRLPNCDPWLLPAAVAGADEPAFLWRDGHSGLHVAAWGCLAWDRLAPGGRGLARAQKTCAAWRPRLWDVAWPASQNALAWAGHGPVVGGSGLHGLARDGAVDAAAPSMFGAFAYGSAMGDAALWGDLAGGGLWLPRVVVYRRATAPGGALSSTRVTVGVQLRPHAALLPCAEHMAAVCRQIFVAATRVVNVGDAALGAAMVPAEDTASARRAWHARVAQAKRSIADRRLYKVVLARRATWHAPPGRRFDPHRSAMALRHQHPGAVTYAVLAAGGAPAFMGASPEVLVRVRGGSLATQAVAGTAPRGASAAHDEAIGRALRADPKECHEHELVVRGILAALQPFCARIVVARQPRLLRLPGMQHLHTPIYARLHRRGDALALCRYLHPTPATGGLPQAAARAWTAAHERLDRGLFAGPIGWLTTDGDGDVAVALRAMLVQPSAAHTYAGAGIVSTSDADAEWRETQLKMGTARAALCDEPVS